MKRDDEPGTILAYHTIKDPRDLADVLHLAAGLGAEVHLIGRSLAAGHPKVLRRLRSWRPELAGHPERIGARRFPGIAAWMRAARERGFAIAAAVPGGGDDAWTAPPPARLAVLFGEETYGLKPEDVERCDHRWSIPLGPGGRFYTIGQSTAFILGSLHAWRNPSAV